jgi:hypothetical protein
VYHALSCIKHILKNNQFYRKAMTQQPHALVLKKSFHPDVSPALIRQGLSSSSALTVIERHAARAVVLKGETAFEAHEVSNGMIPLWMNIYEAIAHNEAVIANSDNKGLSIEREMFMLKVIASELIERDLIERDLIERDLVADKQVAVKTQSIGG